MIDNDVAKKLEEDIIILWFMTENQDFTMVNIIEDEDKAISPLLFISNENMPNFPSVIKEIFGYEYNFNS